MKWSIPDGAQRWIQSLGQYRTVLLVLVAGILLLMMPGGEEQKTRRENPQTAEQTQWLDLEAFEKRMAQALSDIEGAGETSVVLTLKSGSRRILAQDIERDGTRSSTSAVTLGRGSSGEETVVLQTLGPEYQGALVICPGGEDPQVRLRITAAVCALTGLGSDRVSICKSR